MNHILKRRQFLQTTLGVAGLAVAGKASAAAMCGKTVAQTEGPFYPGEKNIFPVNDLTRVEGAKAIALGQIIYLKGQVVDTNCVPVSGVNVEIWQACASGRYNHDQDPNPAPLDPNFRYWGETFTDANGEYMFKTILPGAYPADTDWDRPPHIHFRIAKLGYHELTTQMYFKGQELNDKDKILERVPKRMRDDVIVDFLPNPDEAGTLAGFFRITIEKI